MRPRSVVRHPGRRYLAANARTVFPCLPSLALIPASRRAQRFVLFLVQQTKMLLSPYAWILGVVTSHRT